MIHLPVIKGEAFFTKVFLQVNKTK